MLPDVARTRRARRLSLAACLLADLLTYLLRYACYLTLPGRAERDDFLWSARTVVEKVKTDQRSRALELLCIGFFGRGSQLYPLVVNRAWPLKSGFEANFGVGSWSPRRADTDAPTYPLTSLAHSLAGQPAHSLTHSLTHLLAHSLTHSLTHSLACHRWARGRPSRSMQG